MNRKRPRPYVVCHMVPSIDGRIVLRGWPDTRRLHALYERTASTFSADAWIVGRISMESYLGTSPPPPKQARQAIPRIDYVAPHEPGRYAIAIDPSGRLRWPSGSIDGEHAIAVLTKKVSANHLALLRERGVSYVFGGERTVDVHRVLEKLRALFGIRRLLLEGGGSINGSFLDADVIDELSVLLAPVADGSTGTPTFFDRHGRGEARAFRLLSAERQKGGVVWLRYRRAR